MTQRHAGLKLPRLPACRIFLAGFLALSVQLVASSGAAQSDDESWPCIQGLVPEVSLAVYWPEPIDVAWSSRWKQDNAVAQWVARLAGQQEYGATLQQQLADWVMTIPDSERTESLGLLASGVLDVLNDRRDKFIDGIKRYTRQQIKSAEKIEQGLTEIDERLDQGEKPESSESLAALQQNINWQQRIFDQRESAMISLCDQPVAVEQLMSDIVRDLAQKLY